MAVVEEEDDGNLPPPVNREVDSWASARDPAMVSSFPLRLAGPATNAAGG